MKIRALWKGRNKEVVLLGPGAPLYPEPFFERRVTEVMGTRTLDLGQCSQLLVRQGEQKSCTDAEGKKMLPKKGRSKKEIEK
jgi:uncharacterized protein (DUF4213/DUF364 family)